MHYAFDNSWEKLLHSQFNADYFKNLMTTLEREYATTKVYPSREQLFRSLELTDVSDVKVVI